MRRWTRRDVDRFARAWPTASSRLRRTVRIAVALGLLLTAINQLDMIVDGEATAVTWLKCGSNFVVPFVVSNLGLLSATAGR